MNKAFLPLLATFLLLSGCSNLETIKNIDKGANIIEKANSPISTDKFNLDSIINLKVKKEILSVESIFNKIGLFNEFRVDALNGINNITKEKQTLDIKEMFYCMDKENGLLTMHIYLFYNVQSAEKYYDDSLKSKNQKYIEENIKNENGRFYSYCKIGGETGDAFCDTWLMKNNLIINVGGLLEKNNKSKINLQYAKIEKLLKEIK